MPNNKKTVSFQNHNNKPSYLKKINIFDVFNQQEKQFYKI